MATTSSPTRPLTRSQTAPSMLGKRTTRAAPSRSSSKLSASSMLMTPESTPKKKRVKTSITADENDPRANKENIPPLRDLLLDSSSLSSLPSTPRLSRRSSFSSDISSISTISRSTLRRTQTHASVAVVLPQTPATTTASTFDSLSLVTPPLTPPFPVPFHLRVRSLLRSTSNASGTLMSLAGRETEKAIIESFLHGLDDDADVPDQVLYVSGAPGTGKTALVNSIINASSISKDVKIVFVNCMAISDMDGLWKRLAEELSPTVSSSKVLGRKGSKKALGKAEVAALLADEKDSFKCMLVLDELDNLSGASPALLKPLFSLIALYPKKIKVIGIANTHTLTSSSSHISLAMDEDGDSNVTELSGARDVKIKTIHFAPYEPAELQAILSKRFEGLSEVEVKKLLPTPTLVLLTKKVSSLTGDVRALFEVLRGAIDIAMPSSTLDFSPIMSPAEEKASKATSVTPAHVLAALKSYAPVRAPSAKKSTGTGSNTSETITKVANLNLQARLVVLSLVLAGRRLQATLPLTGSPSSSSPTTIPSTPTKKSGTSPMKRSLSTPTHHSNTSSSSLASQESSVDVNQLYSYYTAILADADSFTAVSRSDFTDLLGVLDTSGLVVMSSPAPSAKGFKRTTSFSSGLAKTKTKAAPSTVRFQSDIREGEVVRGLGILASASTANGQAHDGDALEDDIRRLWAHETSRMKKEARVKDEALAKLLELGEGFEAFEDAMEG